MLAQKVVVFTLTQGFIKHNNGNGADERIKSLGIKAQSVFSGNRVPKSTTNATSVTGLPPKNYMISPEMNTLNIV